VKSLSVKRTAAEPSLLGEVSPSQLAPVVQLASDPPPSQVKLSARTGNGEAQAQSRRATTRRAVIIPQSGLSMIGGDPLTKERMSWPAPSRLASNNPPRP
jgi:hypothetical protein